MEIDIDYERITNLVNKWLRTEEDKPAVGKYLFENNAIPPISSEEKLAVTEFVADLISARRVVLQNNNSD